MRATGWLSYPRLPRIEYTEARVDADIAGTGTGPTTSESTPPAHATRSTRPATYLSTRWGTDGHGSAGLPEISEDRVPRSVLITCAGPGPTALLFRLHHTLEAFELYLTGIINANFECEVEAINTWRPRSAVAQQRPNLVSLSLVFSHCSLISYYHFRGVCTLPELRYRTGASTLNSIGITINQAISPAFTLPKGNFAFNQYQSILSDEIF